MIVGRMIQLLAFIGVAVFVLVLLQISTVLFPDMGYYRIVDSNTIDLNVAVMPCSWTNVSGVTETSSTVSIKIETLPCLTFGASASDPEFRVLTIDLPDDLAGRAITDAQGQSIPMRQ